MLEMVEMVEMSTLRVSSVCLLCWLVRTVWGIWWLVKNIRAHFSLSRTCSMAVTALTSLRILEARSVFPLSSLPSQSRDTNERLLV